METVDAKNKIVITQTDFGRLQGFIESSRGVLRHDVEHPCGEEPEFHLGTDWYGVLNIVEVEYQPQAAHAASLSRSRMERKEQR